MKSWPLDGDTWLSGSVSSGWSVTYTSPSEPSIQYRPVCDVHSARTQVQVGGTSGVTADSLQPGEKKSVIHLKAWLSQPVRSPVSGAARYIRRNHNIWGFYSGKKLSAVNSQWWKDRANTFVKYSMKHSSGVSRRISQSQIPDRC